MREFACSLLSFCYLSPWMLVANQGKLLCVYMSVYIWVCTHPHTSQHMHLSACRLRNTPSPGIQPHHALSTLQLPAVFIHQGNTEACTLLLFSCPSMPLSLQVSNTPTMVSNTTLCLGQACSEPAGSWGWISDVDRDSGVVFVLLKTWQRARSRSEPLPLLIFSLRHLLVLRIKTTTNLKPLCPKVIQTSLSRLLLFSSADMLSSLQAGRTRGAQRARSYDTHGAQWATGRDILGLSWK